MGTSRGRLVAVVAAALVVLAGLALAGSATPAGGRHVDGPRLGRVTVAKSGAITFRWQRVPRARRYEIRFSRDARFSAIHVKARPRAPRVTLRLPRGRWFFEVRSLRPQSRWSAVRRVVSRARAVPAPRQAAPASTRPQRLRVTRVGQYVVGLAFDPPAAGAPAGGYRVEADGRAVATTAASPVDVDGLLCGTAMVFTVRGLGAAGAASAASPPARARTRACTDVAPPGAPGVPVAVSVTDRTVALTWPAATDPDGEVMGYVVRRDGVVLGQPTTPGFLARNLAPATPYTFTVTAKDRAGHLSPSSAPTTVTTAAPVPATGPAYAYLLATTDESFEAFAANYQRVETVAPTFYEVHADGTVAGQDQARVTQFAKLRGVRVEPRFNNQNGPDLHALLTDRRRGDALIANIAGIVAEHGYDGASLDFESGAASDRAALTDFVGRLAAALHAQGATLTVDASAKTEATTTGRSGFYDYPALATRADRIFVMAWDLHWASSPAGPISDIRWVRRILNYVRTVGAGRFVIGTNLYGFDWPLGKRAESYRYPEIRALQAAVGATERWDAEAEEPYFTYTGADGLAHTVYFADTRSVEARTAAVRAAGFQPGLWRIGQEDPAVWTLPSMQP